MVTFVQSGVDIAGELRDLPQGETSGTEAGYQQGFDLMAAAWAKQAEPGAAADGGDIWGFLDHAAPAAAELGRYASEDTLCRAKAALVLYTAMP